MPTAPAASSARKRIRGWPERSRVSAASRRSWRWRAARPPGELELAEIQIEQSDRSFEARANDRPVRQVGLDPFGATGENLEGGDLPGRLVGLERPGIRGRDDPDEEFYDFVGFVADLDRCAGLRERLALGLPRAQQPADRADRSDHEGERHRGGGDHRQAVSPQQLAEQHRRALGQSEASEARRQC